MCLRCTHEMYALVVCGTRCALEVIAWGECLRLVSPSSLDWRELRKTHMRLIYVRLEEDNICISMGIRLHLHHLPSDPYPTLSLSLSPSPFAD